MIGCVFDCACKKAPGISTVAISCFSFALITLVRNTDSIITVGADVSLFENHNFCFLPSAHPLPLIVPSLFSFKGGVDGAVVTSLFHDWNCLCNFIRKSIRKGWTGGKHFCSLYKFGDETVKIRKQIHRWSIPIPFLLSLYLFGEKFEKLDTVAVVKSTKRTRLIHIWSNERAMSMLSIENKNAVQFMKKDIMYYGCERNLIVITKLDEYYDGTTCCILGEKKRKWLVKTVNNLELLVTHPTFTCPINPSTNRETYSWEFENESYVKGV